MSIVIIYGISTKLHSGIEKFDMRTFMDESPNVTVKCRTTKQCRSLVIERFVLF